MKQQAGTQTIQRVFQILALFDDDHPVRSLPEMVELTALNKTTVFRLLTALEHEGYLQRLPDGDYTFGSEAIALGGRAMRANKLRATAHPYLKTVAKATKETITLEILSADKQGQLSALVVDEVVSSHLIGITQYIGSRLPLTSTSSGKVLLAWQPIEERELILEALEKEHPTLDLENFTTQLDAIQLAGIATTQNELELGVMATAAPIFDAMGNLRATLSLAGPSMRITPDRLAEFAAQIQTTALEISHELGYRPTA